jgi:transcriptional regulator with XRE-family HTH domain
MAEKLNIELSAYIRLESGQANTWGKYFEKIVTVLKINPSCIFEGIEIKDFILPKLNEIEGNKEL